MHHRDLSVPGAWRRNRHTVTILMARMVTVRSGKARKPMPVGGDSSPTSRKGKQIMKRHTYWIPNLDIVTEQRADDWIAYTNEHGPCTWESGRTEVEAIGKLVVTLSSDPRVAPRNRDNIAAGRPVHLSTD